MTKDWDHYKPEIKSLYITNGKSLDDVRRILKGRHNFDASVRAYRMKLERWGIRKNKVPATAGSQARPRRAAKKTPVAGSSLVAEPVHNEVSALPGVNFSNWPYDNNAGNDGWGPEFNFPTNDGQNVARNLPMPAFNENFPAPYVPPNQATDLPSDRVLFETISSGTEKELLELLSAGTPVNIRDNFNNSPLHAAITKGNIEMVKDLLKFGADVDAVGFKGKTPLHLSVASKTLVQLILKHQPNMSLQDEEGNSILHYLLRIPNWWSDLDVQTAIRSVLSAGVNVNIHNRLGESPLHRIVAEAIPASPGYMDITFEFLKCKPDVSTPMRNGQSLLGVFLENTGVLLRITDGRYLKGWVDTGFRCLEQFLISGADPNFLLHSKQLLHHCITSGEFWEGRPSEQFLLRLLQEADLDVLGADGDYPLHMALGRRKSRWGGHPPFPIIQITSILIARQVSVNEPNRAGASPLEIWLAGCRPQPSLNKVTMLLLEAGASSTIMTTSGKTLFDLLTCQSRENRTFLIQALLEADIKAHEKDIDVAKSSEWVEVWRSAWKASLWNTAKSNLTKLAYLENRPKSENFTEVIFLVIAERLLSRHRCRLKSFLEKDLERDDVVQDYEEYCAILKDCRDRKAEIDVSFYSFLLDIMDFG